MHERVAHLVQIEKPSSAHWGVNGYHDDDVGKWSEERIAMFGSRCMELKDFERAEKMNRLLNDGRPIGHRSFEFMIKVFLSSRRLDEASQCYERYASQVGNIARRDAALMIAATSATKMNRERVRYFADKGVQSEIANLRANGVPGVDPSRVISVLKLAYGNELDESERASLLQYVDEMRSVGKIATNATVFRWCHEVQWHIADQFGVGERSECVLNWCDAIVGLQTSEDVILHAGARRMAGLIVDCTAKISNRDLVIASLERVNQHLIEKADDDNADATRICLKSAIESLNVPVTVHPSMG